MNEGVLTAARIVVGGAFAIIGVRNVGNHKPISEMIRANRFPMPEFLAATGIAMQVGFGLLMVIGLFPVVSALGLLVFTVRGHADGAQLLDVPGQDRADGADRLFPFQHGHGWRPAGACSGGAVVGADPDGDPIV